MTMVDKQMSTSRKLPDVSLVYDYFGTFSPTSQYTLHLGRKRNVRYDYFFVFCNIYKLVPTCRNFCLNLMKVGMKEALGKI